MKHDMASPQNMDDSLDFLPQTAAGGNSLCWMSHPLEHLPGFYIHFLLLQKQWRTHPFHFFVNSSEISGNIPLSLQDDYIFYWIVMNMLTFESHDSILTTFKQQLINNKRGWDRLRGCGVDFWVVILQRQKGTQSWVQMLELRLSEPQF